MTVYFQSESGGAQAEEMRGSLHYFFDAVMPFLQIFCRSYYQPDKDQFSDEQEKLSRLTLTFEAFMDTVAPLIAIERQLKNIVSSMTSLITATGAIPSSRKEEFRQKYGGGIGSQDVRSDGRKKYEEYYKEEEEVNVTLNIFAENMKRTYCGVNKVQTQIGCTILPNKEYSKVGGDEELPLGQEFQDHLRCFIDTDAKDPQTKYAPAKILVEQMRISHSLQDLSEEEKIEQLELDVRCLQLMRGLIHNEIIRLPDDQDLSGKSGMNMDLVKKEHTGQLKNIRNVQAALDSYGVVDSVLKGLSRPQDDLVRELLAFLAALLFKGNEQVQTSMYRHFTSTRDETFFFAIKNRIQLSTVATREKRLLHAMHMAKVEESVAQEKALQERKSCRVLKRRNMQAPKPAAGTRVGGTTTIPGVTVTQPNSGTLMGVENIPMQKRSKPKKTAEVAPAEPVPEAAVPVSDGLDFKDDGFVELVLRVLGLMCDNQYKDLQDYLREQPDNIKSLNLVAEVTRFLNILYGNVSDKTVQLIIQLIDTLVEFTSGNFHNQAAVFDNKICEYLNHMLRVGDFKGCDDEQRYTLKKSIATLIRALSEENPPECDKEESQTLAQLQEVLEYIDSEVLMKTMVQAYQDMQKRQDGWEKIQGHVEDVGFAYYHVICRKMDLHPSTCTRQALVKTEADKAAWKFFADNTLSIEILKGDVLQKVHFRVKDKNVLREEIKEKFKYSVDRSSPSNKLREFMNWSRDIIKDIKYQRQLHANPITRFFVKSKRWLDPMVLLVSLILCMIVLITWKAPDGNTTYESSTFGNGSAVPDMSDWPGAEYALYTFGGLHNLLSLCIVISYFLCNHPTFPDRCDFMNLWKSTVPGKAEKNESDEDDEGFTKGESHLEVKFFSVSTMYYLMFFTFSVLGTLFYGYFFPLHLLHMVLMNQLLQRVILAVTRNGKSLILVGILGLVIMFMFSLVAFAFFRDKLDEKNGRQCTTAYECFVTIIHHGFVEGMYTTFEQQLEDSSFTSALAVSAFDLIFFILITTIGLNIIFGIIVDTFSELRDSKWQTDNNIKSKCFICNRNSHNFERQAGGFEKHVKLEHNQWAYLFFFIHLDETCPNDYSALELHVYKLYDKNNFAFFPLNRALSLAAEEDGNKQKFETLVTQVGHIIAKMKEEEAAKEREKEKQRQQEWESKHKVRTE